jgi:hypothetical protein
LGESAIFFSVDLYEGIPSSDAAFHRKHQTQIKNDISSLFSIQIISRVADPHHFNVDPDTDFHLNANGDQDPTPH